MSRITSGRHTYPDGKRIRFQAAVGDRIRDMREAAGLGRGKLAAMVELSTSMLEKIESGETSCPLYTAARLAEVFDVLIDELAPVQVEA